MILPPEITKLQHHLSNKSKADAIAAQNRMSPKASVSSKYRIAPPEHKTAAVMALLFPYGGTLHTCYMLRTSHHPEDKHAGQISYPGGQLDSTDLSLEHCAFREVHEEIGIPKDQITLLGSLTELYVFASNFLVYPFVGYCHETPDFIPEPSEVAEVINVPLHRLQDEQYQLKKDIAVRNITLKDVPYYDINGHVLWGATAMITSELLAYYNHI